jgi:hypothetical protein
MKKISSKTKFKFTAITSFFFQIIFLISALLLLWGFLQDRSLITFSFFLMLLYFSYKSFKIGMEYKMKFARDLQKTVKKDQFNSMNRPQKRKFIRTIKKNGLTK